MVADKTVFFEEIRRRNERLWGEKRYEVAQALGVKLRPSIEELALEIIQNAEDAGAKNLGFHLYESGLLIWNDGRAFSENDVRAISGLLVSDKDARSIGHFGIGFKAVLLVTDEPHVLSGAFRFRLKSALDPFPVDNSALPSLVNELYSKGKTVFWLPFRKVKRTPTEKLAEIFDEKAFLFLLFMDSLKNIIWKNEVKHRTSEYVCERTSIKVPDPAWQAYKVEFLYEVDGTLREEYWLRLERSQAIPQDVIAEIVNYLEENGDAHGAKRWRKVKENITPKSAIALRYQPPIAYLPQEGMAFVRLPLYQHTGLRFHISARFAATLDRRGIQENDPLTRWALQELGETLRQLPEKLRDANRLPPSVWHIFPRKDDGKGPFVAPVGDLYEALESGAFIHGEDGGLYSKEDVYLAHNSDVYSLIDVQDLRELTGNSKAMWVSPELRQGYPRELLQEFGVETIHSKNVVQWLANKEPQWFEQQSTEWLKKLYRYLASQRDLLEDIQQIPIVRVHTGAHIQPCVAVFPPSDLPEVLKPFERYLPLIAQDLATDEAVRESLRGLGVREFTPFNVVERLLQEIYGHETVPPADDNRLHIRMLYHLWNDGKIARDDLRKIGELPFLRSQEGKYMSASNMYLPTALGGIRAVEQYFRIAGGRSFVSEDYREQQESKDDWGEFLRALGVQDLPVVKPVKENLSDWEVREWISRRNPSENLFLYSTQGYEGVDWDIDGFEAVYGAVSSNPTVENSRCLWVVMAEVLEQHPKVQNAEVKYFYYTNRSETILSLWIARLREAAWLVDAQGMSAPPRELWDPSLQEVLGPEMRYLHPDIPLRVQKYRKLAEILGIRLSVDIKDVLQYLHDLADQNERDVNKVLPIYQWLAKQDNNEIEDVARHFNSSPLILHPQYGWFRTDEVCWYDPSESVPHLSPAWGKHDLKSFFVQVLGVSEDPQPGHLAKRLLQLAKQKEHPDIEQVRRIADLLMKYWDQLEEEDRHLLSTERCWPGRDSGGTVWWYKAQDLVIPDKERLVNLFQGKFGSWSLGWWALTGLEELAGRLEIPGVSTATTHIKHEGQEISVLARDISTLHRIWPLLIEFANRAGNQNLPTKFPAVKRVEQIYVYYEIKGIRSAPDTDEAYFDRDNWHLYLTPDALESLADPVGDALERALEVPGLREFTKDVWEALGSKLRLQKILQRWERRIQVSLSNLHTLVEDDRQVTPAQPQLSSSHAAHPEDKQLNQIRAEERDEDYVPLTLEELQSLTTKSGPRPNESAREESTRFKQETPVKHQIGVAESHVKPVSRYRGQKGDADVEKYAMKKAEEWWRQQGYRVQDVSKQNRGYDLVVENGEEYFVVEVKGLSSLQDVVMTENEWKKAEEYGTRYWLMVIVLNTDEILPLQNPAEILEAERFERVQVLYRVRKDHILQRHKFQTRSDSRFGPNAGG
ncbi:DUF3883 domain-containing protein [Rhodothermus profundi]|uniref:Protein NO VEIN C-terminal domain-containing protein n=1 Tax=Rhodothermus profundi TaxID=633813 RepID=A0A1M6UF09_9BACT|nr:DUF3883 domain-containing protein [Rhodothermus profundi]SHK67794.1 protein of unknown function [Rhodothermus profundi]